MYKIKAPHFVPDKHHRIIQIDANKNRGLKEKQCSKNFKRMIFHRTKWVLDKLCTTQNQQEEADQTIIVKIPKLKIKQKSVSLFQQTRCPKIRKKSEGYQELADCLQTLLLKTSFCISKARQR
jgi:hypothetical protein